MTWRRAVFALLFAATMAGSLALAVFALSPGGLDAVDIVLLMLFAITLPWMIAGLWNAVIGFLIMAPARHAGGRVYDRGLRVGVALRADVLFGGGCVRFPLRLLGRAREHRRTVGIGQPG